MDDLPARTFVLVWLAIVALPVLGLAYQVWLFFALKRAAKRLGLSVTGDDRSFALTGVWQGIAVELAQSGHSLGKAPVQYTVVSRARLPKFASLVEDRQGAILDPVIVVDGWVEHRGSDPLHHRRLEALLDALARAARRAARSNDRSEPQG